MKKKVQGRLNFELRTVNSRNANLLMFKFKKSIVAQNTRSQLGIESPGLPAVEKIGLQRQRDCGNVICLFDSRCT